MTDVAPLPPSDDPFWEGEKQEQIRIKEPLTCKQGEHYFVRKSGTEARCKSCPMGFNLTPGYEVKDGHISLHGQRLI